MTAEAGTRPGRSLPGRAVLPLPAGAVGYEVYIRSFADGNGDGIGDLPGLVSRLDHLSWLGVDLLWVTPFFVSPMADFGYDVADYLAVDPLFGTFADVDALIERAHALGIRVIFDLVANHTSSEHAWFQDARRGRERVHRDWYVWRDPAPDGGPPNNWLSYFGGPAWTLDPATGQYYLHLFLPEQPDLNWANPAVVDAFEDVLRFWFERGVDGFRLDVAQGYAKDPAMRSNPVLAPIVPGMGPRAAFNTLDHVHDIDQPANIDVFRSFRKVADAYSAMLVGEVYLPVERLGRYVGDDVLHQAHVFEGMRSGWDPSALAATLRSGVRVLGEHAGWVQCSHDDTRSVTRFGGGALGRRRALVVATLHACLPGMPFLYQGEELALEQVEIAASDAADPVAVRGSAVADGRDGTRTPMPWQPGPGHGFTTGQPWLPFGPVRRGGTVAEQRDDPDAPIHAYRELIAVRHQLGGFHGATVEWIDVPGLLGFRRDAVFVAACVGREPVAIPATGRVVFSTTPTIGPLLQPDEAVILLTP